MIHPTAIIDPKAELGEGVEIGPYVVIEKGVIDRRGDEDQIPRLHQRRNPDRQRIVRFISSPPSEKRLRPLPTRGRRRSSIIGDNNVIREYVTLNRATVAGGGKTVIGNNNYFMAYSHVAHDCTYWKPGHPRQRSHPGRTHHDRRLCHDRRTLGGPSVLPDRDPCLYQRPDGRQPGYSSLHAGRRRPGQAVRTQHRGSETPPFFRRGHEGPEKSLPHHLSLRA